MTEHITPIDNTPINNTPLHALEVAAANAALTPGGRIPDPIGELDAFQGTTEAEVAR